MRRPQCQEHAASACAPEQSLYDLILGRSRCRACHAFVDAFVAGRRTPIAIPARQLREQDLDALSELPVLTLWQMAET